MPGGILTQIDLFGACVRSPLIIQNTSLLQVDDNGDQHIKSLTPRENKDDQDKNREARKELLRLFYKIWSGFTKYLRSQIRQGRPVDTLYMGKFGVLADQAGAQMNPNNNNLTKMISFIPSIEFIDSGNYIYDQSDKYNLGPFTAPSKFSGSLTSVSITSIASAVKTTKDTVRMVMRQIFNRLSILCKEGKQIQLDLKIGTFFARKGGVKFLNLGSQQLKDDIQAAGQRGGFKNRNHTFDGRRNKLNETAPVEGSIVTQFTRGSIPTPISRRSGIESHKSSISQKVKRALFQNSENQNQLQNGVYPSLNQYINKGLRGAMQHRSFFGSPAHGTPTKRQMIDFHLKQMRQKEKRQRIEHRAKQVGMEKALQQIELEDERKKQRKKLDISLDHALNSNSKRSILGSARPLSNPKSAISSSRAQSIQPYSNMNSSVTEGRFLSSNRKVPMDYISGYPNFLRPDHEDERKWKFDQKQINLNKALNRYEEVLKKKKKERQDDLQNYYDQLAQNQLFNQNVERMRTLAMEQNKRVLLKQMNESRQRKESQRSDRQNLVRTHFGPEDTDIAVKNQENFGIKKKMKFRDDIINQITVSLILQLKIWLAKLREEKIIKIVESFRRMLEYDRFNKLTYCIIALATAARVLADQRKAILDKAENHKSQLKSVWDIQAKHRQKNAEIDKYFKI